MDESVLQSEHFLSITAEDSLLIATVSPLPKLHLTGDSFVDFMFHIIEILLYLSLIDEPAKPVRVLAVREMKIILDEVGVINLALYDERIGVEVRDGHGVDIQSPQRNVFLFQWIVCGLFVFVYTHNIISRTEYEFKS